MTGDLGCFVHTGDCAYGGGSLAGFFGHLFGVGASGSACLPPHDGRLQTVYNMGFLKPSNCTSQVLIAAALGRRCAQMSNGLDFHAGPLGQGSGLNR